MKGNNAEYILKIKQSVHIDDSVSLHIYSLLSPS